MKLNLSAREQQMVALLSGLGLMVLWVYFAYIVGPLRREGRQLAERAKSTREELRMLEAATANEAAVREQYSQVEQSVSVLRQRMPDEAELPDVIELLSNLASQAQVKIQTIFPQRAAILEEGIKADSAPVVYKDVMIQIDALAGYHQLGTFLGLVESSQKPMRLVSLRISSDQREPKRHRVKLLIRAYFNALGSGDS